MEELEKKLGKVFERQLTRSNKKSTCSIFGTGRKIDCQSDMLMEVFKGYRLQ
jgi:hypothetical protein